MRTGAVRFAYELVMSLVGCLSVVFCRFIDLKAVRRCNSFRLLRDKGPCSVMWRCFFCMLFIFIRKDSADLLWLFGYMVL